MSLLKLPLAATWNLASGLEVIDNAIRLAVGGGAWDPNSLDMTTIPAAPWLSTGAQFAGVVDGELLEINDSGAGFRFFQLLPPDWDADLTVAFTMYFKAKAVVNSDGVSAVLLCEDGAKLYQIKFYPDGTFSIEGTSTFTHDVAKYPWTELFISDNGGSSSIWIWNPITDIWDLLQSGLAPGASGVDRILFGAAGNLGRSFWDFIKWKIQIETTPYRTSAPVAEMAAAVAINNTIDQVDIEEAVLSGSNIRYQYDVGAGYNGSWITLAALQTALVDTSPATLQLKAQFNSDGITPASMALDGTQSVLGGTCDYPIEANVLEGIEYDDGDLTGTLKKYSVDTNPNDTKRKRILDVLDTRLKAINTGNGYKTDLGDNVFRWRVTEMNPFDPEEELPGVNYVDDDQRPEQSSHGPETVEHSMQVMLHVYATTEAELRSARADIVEAIGADVGFSTLAQDAQLIDDGSDTAHEQDKIWSTEMFLQIMYTTGRWDPYE